MNKLILAILLLAGWAALPGHAQSFDQYGGIQSTTCATTPGSGGANVFWPVKSGNRWWFCDPAGHLFMAMAMADYTATGQPNTFFDCETNTANMTGKSLAWTNPSGSIWVATLSPNPWTPAAVYQDELNNAGTGVALTKCATCTAANFATTMTQKSWFYDSVANNLYVWLSTGDSPTNHATMNYPMDVSTIFPLKYGTDIVCTSATGAYHFNCYNWASQALKRSSFWGFNAIGQDSVGYVGPYGTCTGCSWPNGVQPQPEPTLIELKPAEIAAANHENNPYLTSPIKDLVYGTGAAYVGWRGGANYDMFDPGLNIQWQWDLNNCKAPSCRLRGDANSLYTLAIFTDDNDQMFAVQSGPDFAAGDTKPNSGFIGLITSPVQTFINGTRTYGALVVYPDNKVYSKVQATNPAHGTCSVLKPCSLRDFLYDEYSGSISALNTAWGSTYTTWDSSGTTVTGESFGTANGTKTDFTYTLTHAPVDPFSVGLYVGGTMQAGDCPWVHGACSSAKITNTGWIKSPTTTYLAPIATISSCSESGTTATCTTSAAHGLAAGDSVYVQGSSVSGYNGVFTVTAVGTTTTFSYTAASGLAASTGGSESPNYVIYSTGQVGIKFASAPANATTLTLNYVCCGWMNGGTGLADEDGSHGWVGANSYCMEGPDPLFPNYFSCSPSSGDSAAGMPIWPNDAFPLSGSGIVVSGSTATVTIAAPSSGARTLYNGQSVYISGTNTLCDGGPYVISNSGNTATTFTFTAPSGCNSVAPSTVTTNGYTVTVSWVNSALGHDLDNWVTQYSGEFFKVMHDGLRMKDVSGNPVTCAIPQCWAGSFIPNFGIDNFSGYTYSKSILGAKPYIDGAFVGFIQWAKVLNNQPAEEQYAYQYFTHYLGDIPIIDSTQSPSATADSDYSCYGNGNQPNQAARGVAYYNNAHDMLMTPSANGTYQVLGFSWWEWPDAQNFNQGIVSLHDNAYDGAESLIGPQSCAGYYSSNISCGGEPGNYGNAITEVNGISAATHLWLNLGSSPSPNSRIQNNGDNAKVHQ